MSHINVTINARQYRMACEEGQEVRLLKLAESLETRIQSLRGKFGEIGDARLTVMAALDALESAVERRRDADRDEDELATRIQALGTDRSRLADELDVSLVKTRRLERANRELGDRLDAAIAAIREVLGGGETEAEDSGEAA